MWEYEPVPQPQTQPQLGAYVPGLKPETIKMVLVGSIALVGVSVALYFVLKAGKKGGANA